MLTKESIHTDVNCVRPSALRALGRSHAASTFIRMLSTRHSGRGRCRHVVNQRSGRCNNHAAKPSIQCCMSACPTSPRSDQQHANENPILNATPPRAGSRGGIPFFNSVQACTGHDAVNHFSSSASAWGWSPKTYHTLQGVERQF